MGNISDFLNSIPDFSAAANDGAYKALEMQRKKNELENEALRSNIKISEQNENQTKLLNQLIELQNKSILENQKTSEKNTKQSRTAIIVGVLTLIVAILALFAPIVLTILGF